MAVIICYFPIRGRAEVTKLLCAATNTEFTFQEVDFNTMKADRTQYPFAQCPRLVDGDIDMSQSNAIIRHLARKHGLYGATEKEHCKVDMIIDGVEAIRAKYIPLIYDAELKEPAKTQYWQTHGTRDSASGDSGGAHFAYLDGLLARNNGGSGYFVGGSLTAADLCLFQIVDLHQRIYKEEMEATYPLLVAHHTRIAELPAIKKYLASPACLPVVNGNNVG